MNTLKILLFCFIIQLSINAFPCANIIVTKGASADGSCMLVYTNDGEWLYHLYKKGSVWVSRKIPDGSICAHVNMSRIGGFPLD